MITFFSINKSISQNLTFITKHTKENGSSIQESNKFNFSDGWLTKTDLNKYDSDVYPSSNDGGNFDNSGNYFLVYNAKNFMRNNPLDFSNKYPNDIRLYKIVFDNKDGNVLYILEVGKKNGREIEKYYITELGNQTFKN